MYDKAIELLNYLIEEEIEAADLVSMFSPMDKPAWRKIILCKTNLNQDDFDSIYSAIKKRKDMIFESDAAKAERRQIPWKFNRMIANATRENEKKI